MLAVIISYFSFLGTNKSFLWFFTIISFIWFFHSLIHSKNIYLMNIYLFLKYYFIFKLYNIVLVLPNIEMNPPQVYMCSPSWSLLPPASPYHPSGSSQCTSPKHPVSCIEPGLVTHSIYDIIHISMPFSQIIPPSPSPTESKRLFLLVFPFSYTLISRLPFISKFLWKSGLNAQT